MADVLYINGLKEFEEKVLNSSLPTIVDFTAVWCGPCKMVDPIIKELAVEWQGKANVYKCDADQNSDIITKYGIMGIPTVILFNNGSPAERVTGYKPKNQLMDKFLPHL
ncbi:MAG TPA: thioredoxin [Anaerolineales bacterium]|nr:thioredoxin [Anaerolineales bacterium]